MKLYANDLEDWEPLDLDDDEPSEARTEPDPHSWEAFLAARGLNEDDLIGRDDSTWDDLWAAWSRQEDARHEAQKEEVRAAQAKRDLESRTAQEMGSVRLQLDATRARMKEVAAALKSADDLIERNRLAAELSQLEDHATRLEISLPFVAMDETAFAAELESREIRWEQASAHVAELRASQKPDPLGGPAAPSAQLRRAEREAEEAARAFEAAKREAVRRQEVGFVAREKQRLLEAQASRRLGMLRREALVELDRRLRREGYDAEERDLRVRLHARKLDQREDELLARVRKDIEAQWGKTPPPDPLAVYEPDNPGALMPRNLQPVPPPPPRRPADTSRVGTL